MRWSSVRVLRGGFRAAISRRYHLSPDGVRAHDDSTKIGSFHGQSRRFTPAPRLVAAQHFHSHSFLLANRNAESLEGHSVLQLSYFHSLCNLFKIDNKQQNVVNNPNQGRIHVRLTYTHISAKTIPISKPISQRRPRTPLFLAKIPQNRPPIHRSCHKPARQCWLPHRLAMQKPDERSSARHVCS